MFIGTDQSSQVRQPTFHFPPLLLNLPKEESNLGAGFQPSFSQGVQQLCRICIYLGCSAVRLR